MTANIASNSKQRISPA